MKRIKTYKAFEASTEGTYLAPEKFGEESGKEYNDISKARKIYGKIFREAPTTKDISWGIEFKLVEDHTKGIVPDSEFAEGYSKVYKVVFTDEFFKNFIKKDADESWWKKFLSVFGIGEMSFKPLKDIEIFCEPFNSNRIHFPMGISEDFRGIGLGYVIYESFIKFLGYASSGTSASHLAQKVWSQVAGDPDFYTAISRTARSGRQGAPASRSGAILAVHKDCDKDITTEICKWMMRQQPRAASEYSDDAGNWSKIAFEGFSIDPSLLSKYPGVKKTFEDMQKAAFYRSIEDEHRN